MLLRFRGFFFVRPNIALRNLEENDGVFHRFEIKASNSIILQSGSFLITSVV